MTPDDHELLTQWRDGDRQAGGELIDRHFRALRRFFHNKVTSVNDADDLLQRTFVGCVEGIVRFREDATFRTWLFAVAHNVLRDWFREKQRNTRIEFHTVSAADLAPGPSTALAHHHDQKLLLEALRAIPFESQVVLELYFWEQYPAKQIAVVMDLPIGTVRSRIRKAKQELQAQANHIANTRHACETTLEMLDDWARRIREGWS